LKRIIRTILLQEFDHELAHAGAQHKLNWYFGTAKYKKSCLRRMQKCRTAVRMGITLREAKPS